MKKADWVFVGVAVLAALAVFYLFVRPAARAARGGSAAAANQSKVTGSSIVMPDATGGAAPTDGDFAGWVKRTFNIDY